MWQVLAPVMTTLLEAFKGRAAEVEKKTGVAAASVEAVTDSLKDLLLRDERMRQLAADELEKARQHDVATFDKDDVLSNRLRSSVRPVCTFVALGWYVTARSLGIPLTGEDYAIVGGVLAFWFGFRPFEKRS